MKRAGIGVVFLMTGMVLYGQADRRNEVIANPVLRTERLIEYSWDAQNAEWLLSNTIQYEYTYTNGETHEVITLDYYTGVPKSRITYFYTDEKILQLSLYQIMVSGEWVNTRRDMWYQDDEGLNSEAIIQFFRNGEWSNYNRYTAYQYDGRRLRQYTVQIWSGTDWVDSYYDDWYYDESGRLASRQQTRVDATPINRYEYITGSNNLRESMTIYSWVNGNWSDYTRRLYEYNSCGKTSAVVYQDFRGGLYVNTMRHEYAYSVYLDDPRPGTRVAMCHKGKTTYVPLNTVEQRLQQGDCLGPCYGDEDSQGSSLMKSDNREIEPPFTVFPNPARDQITVRLTGVHDIGVCCLELADFSGKTLRSVRVTDEVEIVLPRENLRPGIYFIRLIGDEVFSQSVILK